MAARLDPAKWRSLVEIEYALRVSSDGRPITASSQSYHQLLDCDRRATDSLVDRDHPALQQPRHAFAFPLVLAIHPCAQSKARCIQPSHRFIHIIVHHHAHHRREELVPRDGVVHFHVHNQCRLKIRGVRVLGMFVPLPACEHLGALADGLGDERLELWDRSRRDERSDVGPNAEGLYAGEEDIDEVSVRGAVDENQFDANAVLAGLAVSSR